MKFYYITAASACTQCDYSAESRTATLSGFYLSAAFAASLPLSFILFRAPWSVPWYSFFGIVAAEILALFAHRLCHQPISRSRQPHSHIMPALRSASHVSRSLLFRHRGTENRCHWTLDVTFEEDLCGTRDATASRNLSTMREMAIGLLRAHPSKKTLPLKQQQATLDPNFRLRLLANFHA